MASTFTLVSEATQGEQSRGPVPIPAGPPTTVRIDMLSADFPTDPTLSFRFMLEESFNGGVTWLPASGFPASSSGGTAGQPTKGGGVSTGLPSVMYAFDGQARLLRCTGTPLVNGAPGSFDWGLKATLV